MSQTTSIHASSKVSVKLRDNFYTVEYGESRSLDENDDVVAERERLWCEVNHEVDNQVEEILKAFK